MGFSQHSKGEELLPPPRGAEEAEDERAEGNCPGQHTSQQVLPETPASLRHDLCWPVWPLALPTQSGAPRGNTVPRLCISVFSPVSDANEALREDLLN